MQCPKCPHDIPEGSTRCIYCGAAAPDAVSGPPPVFEAEGERFLDRSGNKNLSLTPEIPAQDVLLTLSAKRARRRKPMGKVTLLILFLASFACGGLLVWLLR